MATNEINNVTYIVMNGPTGNFSFSSNLRLTHSPAKFPVCITEAQIKYLR